MIIDTVNGKYTYSNAGHPAPFLIHAELSRIENLSNSPGPALGMIPDTFYENHEREMTSGDMVFFFTDGLWELPNKDDVQFGAEELQRAIQHNMHLPSSSFVEAIMYAADAFADGLDSPDDITLLAVSYHAEEG
jgi:sigma-B regulation protein RsbU (phosphoserine phosphatase)